MLVGCKLLALETVGTLTDNAEGCDIVSSAWKHVAVHKRTGQGVASLLEEKGSVAHPYGLCDSEYSQTKSRVG